MTCSCLTWQRVCLLIHFRAEELVEIATHCIFSTRPPLILPPTLQLGNSDQVSLSVHLATAGYVIIAGSTHTIQSTASMRDRSLVGRPMASRMMAMVMIPPAGMPAAPTLEAVAVTLQTKPETSLNARMKGAAGCGIINRAHTHRMVKICPAFSSALLS